MRVSGEMDRFRLMTTDSLAPMLYGYYLGSATVDSVYSLGILLKHNRPQPPRLRLLVLPDNVPQDTLAADFAE